MDRDFVINIILRARDEIAGTVAKAAAEISALDKAAGGSGFGNLNKDAERLADTVRNKVNKAMADLRGEMGKSGNDVERLQGKFGKLSKEAEHTNRKLNATDLGKLERGLKGAAQEVENLEQKLKRTDPNLYRHEYDQLGQALDKAKAKYAGISSEVQSYGKHLDDLSRINAELSRTTDEHSRALSRAESTYQKQAKAVAKMKVERDKLAHSTSADKINFSALDEKIVREKAKLYKLAADVELLNSMGINIDVDLQTKGFDEHALQVEIEKKALGKTVHVPVEADVSRFIAEMAAADAAKDRLGRAPGGGGGGGFLSWFKELDKQASKNSHSIAAFDNSLRGLAVLAIVTTAQQLLTVVTSLGGELIMLAGSATMAGSALGEALAAGAAQALPVVGLLVSSIARVAAVISAVKQAELMKQQESYSGEKEEGKLEGAEEGVVNATEAVAAARENLRQSEQNLTKARFDARRELQDLILTERQAELASKGATLSQLESNLALRKAMSTGSITEFAQAQLNVEEARTSGTQARMNLSRARQDVRFQERGSPFRPDTGVRDAEREAEQSRKSLVQAERSAKAAQRSLDEAATGGLASAGKLNYMLAQLDDSERRLYKNAKKLYSVYKEVTRPITDIIVNSFDYGVKKAIRILRNPELDSAMERLAKSMGSNFKRVIDLFSSPRTIHFFSLMADDAAKNIRPITSVLLSFARTWMHIAEAASPILHDIIGWIQEGAKSFEEWVGKGKGLREFFREGEHMLKAWLGLTHAVINLFLALVEGSAKQGTEQVEDLTDKINEAAQWLEDHQERVEEFFHDVGEVMSALGEVILALAAEILRAFNVDNTKSLGDFIMRILIPALGQSIILFGTIVSIIDRISKTPAGEFILRFGAMVLILKTVLSPISQSMLALVSSASKFANFMAAAVGYMMGIPKATMEAQGPIRALTNQVGLTRPAVTTVGEVSTGTAPGSTSRRGIKGLGGRLSGLGARAGAGLGIAGTGLAIGTVIGGPAGKAIDFASVGAGLGMFAGPEGAAIGAGIGLAADAMLELLGSEKKLSPVQRHLNALTEVYPELLENAEGAIQNLTTTEESLREAKSKVRNASQSIHDLEQKINRMREDGAGPKKIRQAEEELTQVRKEQNTSLREKRRLEGATPAEKEVVFASTTRALANVDLRRKAEEKHLARVERAGKEEGWTPELEKKFTAAQKQVNKFREESQKLSRTLHGLGPAGAKAAQEINHSWAKQEFGLQGKGLINSINAARERIQKLREQPKSPFTQQQINASQEQLKHYKRMYEKYFGSIKDYLKQQWRKEIAEILGSEFNLPKIRKALREGAGSESAEARGKEMYRALGGPIGSGYGGGDRVHLVAEEGEHIWNKDEVRNAGGHGALYALRSFFGRGGQSSGSHYAEGGAVRGSSSGGSSGALINLDDLLGAIQSFGGQALSTWQGIWGSMLHESANSIGNILQRLDGLQKNGSKSINKFEVVVKSSFGQMLKVGKHNMDALSQAVYQGVNYISKATDQALKGFGGKPLGIAISRPGSGGGKGDSAEGKAGGGFIGSQGERGADEGLFRLGRGEAVLNWAHQKIVDPAMQFMYGFGLNDMFRTTHGEHGLPSARGLARGRPGGEGGGGGGGSHWSLLIRALNLMNSRHFPYDWGGGHETSPTPLEPVDCSGAVSYAVQHAGYNVPTMTTPALAAWPFPRGKGDVTIYYKGGAEAHTILGVGDKFWGTSGFGHPGWTGAGWFTEEPSAEYLNEFQTMHLPDIKAPASWSPGGFIDKIRSPKIKGPAGKLKNIGTKALGAVTKAANDYLSKHAPTAMGGGQSLKDIMFGGKLPADLKKYNHVYAEHNSADGDWGGQKMPFNAIAELAEWAGMPGITMAQVTKGESGQRPGATGEDPGGTKGLGLWMITTGFNDALIRMMGGIKAMLNPIINAKAAKKIYDSQGLGAWYGTDFVSGDNLHYRKSFAKGGIISELLGGGAGGAGQAIPILAHMGEWILNSRQQNKLAKLLGISIDKLKGLLGFSGGPTSFAGGGEPKAGGDKGKEAKGPDMAIEEAIRLGPMINLENYTEAVKFYFHQLAEEIKRGRKGINEEQKDLATFLTNIFAHLEADLNEWKEGWEVLSSRLQIGLAKMSVHLRGKKIVGAGESLEAIAKRELANMYKELNYMLGERGGIVKSLKFAQKSLAKARGEGDAKAVEVAENAVKRFRRKLTENEVSVAEAQKTILEKQQSREAESVNRIIEGSERKIGRSFSKDESFAAYAEEEEKLDAALTRARKSRNTELVKQIEAEKQAIEIGRVEAINKQAEGGLSFRTSRASIASAMGFSQAATTWNSYTIDVFKQQSSELQGALNQARASGNAALTGQIEQELQQIEVSIAEATAAMFQASIDAVEKRFARANAYRGMAERISQAKSVFGFAPQIAEQKQQFLYQERSTETGQINESQRLLSEAIGKGFGPDVTEPLEERIWDLTAQLAENEAAIYSNTVAIRQAYIDQIQERSGFVGGVFKTLESIVTGLGGLTGVVNQAKIVELLEAQANQLGGAGWELRGQLGAFSNERMGGSLNWLLGLKGEELVSAIQSLDFRGIENFLGPGSEAEKQFQALINAILENEVAVIENTKQLEEAMKENQIQSFTSTAWQWFRKAIFTGMGGLMPAYAEGTPFYSAAEGGEVGGDGPFNLHRGELIIPNNYSTILRSLARAGALAGTFSAGSIPGKPLGIDASTGGWGLSAMTSNGMSSEIAALREELSRRTQNIETNVYEAEPSDPTYLSNRLAFAVKNPAT